MAAGKYSDTGTYARRITRYSVPRGDTVETVAENFAVPARMVRGWNHLRGNSLSGRRVLYLHLPVTPGAPGYEVASKASTKASKKAAKPTVKAATASVSAGVVQHKVRQGETLYSIASSYKT